MRRTLPSPDELRAVNGRGSGAAGGALGARARACSVRGDARLCALAAGSYSLGVHMPFISDTVGL
eukprot:6891781-Prymnesium_polylepis.1